MQDAAGKGTLGRPVEYVKALEHSQGVSWKGLQECWDAKWQDYSVQAEWGNTVPSEVVPWEDTKAFLDSFEQVAKACRWPRREWAARLLPALNGEAEQAFRGLEVSDREDYGKVKAAILRGEGLRMEMQRQHFRQFSCQEVEDPRTIHSQVQELCHQWLKPKTHSKEQILELLILEQFLASLPPELQGWIRAGGPDTCSQAVALAEEFLLSQQVAKTEKWQGSWKNEGLDVLNIEEDLQDLGPDTNCKEAKGNSHDNIIFIGNGIKHPSTSSLSPSLERQEMAERNPNKMTIREVGEGTLHIVEQNLTPPGKQTLFSEALQEEDRKTDCLDSEKGRHINGEKSLWDGKDSDRPSRIIAQISQENVLEATEKKEGRGSKDKPWMQPLKMHSGCDQKTIAGGKEDGFSSFREGAERRKSLKVEKSVCEKNKLEHSDEIPEQNNLTKGFPRKRPMAGEKEGNKFPEDFTASLKKHPRNEIGLFSKYGRRYQYKPEFVAMYTTESVNKCLQSNKSIHHNTCLSGIYELCVDAEVDKKLKCQSHHKINNSRSMFTVPQRTKETKPCRCALERKQNVNKYNLRTSLKPDPNEKQFEFSPCAKCSGTEMCLKRHWSLQTRERPFKCPDCEKSFFNKYHMIRHRDTHEGKKPHKCPDCDKRFTRKDHMIRHRKRTHERKMSQNPRL